MRRSFCYENRNVQVSVNANWLTIFSLEPCGTLVSEHSACFGVKKDKICAVRLILAILFDKTTTTRKLNKLA